MLQSLWFKKAIWLIGLTVFFYLTYNGANYFTAWRAQTEVIPHLIFDWEYQIPFIPWTIIPYWSENLFYGLAILLAINLQQLHVLCKRLLAVQIICVLFFLLFPLQQINALNRPELPEIWGRWFDLLMKFDKPYNQAPSLHIALLVVLWTFYVDYFHRIAAKYLISLWFGLIALSVLTTWQHHFIDLLFGLLAGSFVIWCFPKGNSSLFHISKKSQNKRWFGVYFFFAITFFIFAMYFSLGFVYPALSFLLVALNYGFLGKKGFPKKDNGRYSLSQWCLFLPSILIAYLNSILWTRSKRPYHQILPNLYLGSIPKKNKELATFASVVDCCAELPVCFSFSGYYYPNFLLDMTPLTCDECRTSAFIINQALKNGKTLVYCALGFSRSATSIVAYLMIYGDQSMENAITLVKQKRNGVVIGSKQMAQLKQLEQLKQLS